MGNQHKGCPLTSFVMTHGIPDTKRREARTQLCNKHQPKGSITSSAMKATNPYITNFKEMLKNKAHTTTNIHH